MSAAPPCGVSRMSRNVVFSISMSSAPPWNPFESQTPRISPFRNTRPRRRVDDVQPALQWPGRRSGDAARPRSRRRTCCSGPQTKSVKSRNAKLHFPRGLVVAILDQEVPERLVRAADDHLPERRPPGPAPWIVTRFLAERIAPGYVPSRTRTRSPCAAAFAADAGRRRPAAETYGRDLRATEAGSTVRVEPDVGDPRYRLLLAAAIPAIPDQHAMAKARTRTRSCRRPRSR